VLARQALKTGCETRHVLAINVPDIVSGKKHSSSVRFLKESLRPH